MIRRPPKVRADLTVREHQTAAGLSYVIKDGLRAQFYRLGEAEHFILTQLDGETPLDVVRQRTETQFGAQLSEEALAAFVARLEKGGLLEQDGAANAPPRRPPKRIRGNILYLRCKLLDPDRMLDRLSGKVRFAFTPWFVALVSVSILLAGFTLVANWGEARENLSSLYRLSSVPMLVITVFLVITAHEFAHGLTCKHFGGQVNEMGFLLMYFQPAFFCNVSDAWLFTERSKRLWVAFAGPFFELFLWSLAVFAWRLTNAETIISHIALIIMATSGIKTLLNFNPMLKWDGYYLLSDWLGIPNLRRRAFRYVGDLIRCLWGGSRGFAAAVPPRERRILLVYGLIAVVGSFSLLWITIATVGTRLVQSDQTLAFMLFVGLLGSRVRLRFRRLFGKSSGDPDDPDDVDDDEPAKNRTAAHVQDSRPDSVPDRAGNRAASTPAAPAAQPALPAPAASGNGHNGNGKKRPATSAPEPAPSAAAASETARRREGSTSESPGAGRNPDPAPQTAASSEPAPAPEKRKSRRRSRLVRFLVRTLKLVVFGAVVTALLLYVHLDLRVSGAFNVLPVQNADVRVQVEGIIEQVCVQEGSVVHPGDLVARLSEDEVRAEQNRLAAQIEESRSRLKLLELGARTEEIDLARIVVAKVAEQLRFARERAERDRRLYEQQLLSLNDYEFSLSQVASLQSDSEESTNKLALLLAGTRPEEIQAMKAHINSLEAQRSFCENQLVHSRVLSPGAGIVTTPALQLKALEHQLVKKGDLIAKVHELQTITVLIAVPEREIADVRIGQRVRVKVRAFPEKVFDGAVTQIATTVQGAAAPAAAGAPAAAAGSAGSGPATANTILVSTEIENQAGLLKPGMTGIAKISCGDRRLLDLLQRRLSRTLRVEFWSWW
jgi:putative peptide zinc metalloprotease protein